MNAPLYLSLSNKRGVCGFSVNFSIIYCYFLTINHGSKAESYGWGTCANEEAQK